VHRSGHILAEWIDGDLELHHVGEATLGGTLSGDIIGGHGGPIHLEGEVWGDIRLEHVQGVVGSVIHGDVYLRHIYGPIHIRHLVGTADIRSTHGEVAIEAIGGDMIGRDVRGITATEVSGEVDIRTALYPEATYTIAARGDVLFACPPTSHASIDICAAASINHLPVDQIQVTTGSWKVHLGQGTATVRLVSERRVILVPLLGRTLHEARRHDA
jgi:hypothetical protein